MTLDLEHSADRAPRHSVQRLVRTSGVVHCARVTGIPHFVGSFLVEAVGLALAADTPGRPSESFRHSSGIGYPGK